jgi:histone deacetylase HOS3
MSPTTYPKSPLTMSTPPVEEKPPLTANSVASSYFADELETLHNGASCRPTDAVVILHDSCYGHRYSRPRTSRSGLSTIVERPERVKACVLGVATAYVRLGQRHADGAYPIHPRLDPISIPSYPFRIQKTRRKMPIMSPAVTNVHGTKWMEELKLMCESAEGKLAMGGKELQRPDMNRGTDEPPAKLHEGDLYLCSESLDALEGALGAVCEAVDTVFTTGPRRAFVAVRPPGHHCSASHPSGFCWVNNVHVGIMHGAMTHSLTHAAIIDFDLHHGDGSQSIAWAHNKRAMALPKNAAAWKKASIGYFSLHDINSYPCEMGDDEKVKNASLCIDNAHGQNVWNVHLQPWKSEAEFWHLYETKYAIILEKTRSYLHTQAERLRSIGQVPKAAIFFSAGFDASEWESAGMQRHNVNVPTEFYARLAQDVVKISAEEGNGVSGRVISVLEGGYSDRALFSGVFSHITGLVGDQTIQPTTNGHSGLGYEMGQRMGINPLSSEAQNGQPSLASLHDYDPTWWSSSELDKLETVHSNPPSEPRKPRHITPPTYSSPTQASTAKIIHTARVRRSTSGLSSLYATGSPSSRAPTPPPPDVPWTVAAHELSKLLIPTDRQTDSCKPEDLNAEATKARRDRQSLLLAQNDLQIPVAALPSIEPIAAPVSFAPRMSLRERKPAKLTGVFDEEEEDKFAKNRRKTVPGNVILATEKASQDPIFIFAPPFTMLTTQLIRLLPVVFQPSQMVTSPQSARADVLVVHLWYCRG